MNAGKSTALLQAAYNYAERGMQTMLFTAQLDGRAAGRIASRIGIAADAHRFGPDTDFRELGPAPEAEAGGLTGRLTGRWGAREWRPSRCHCQGRAGLPALEGGG